MIGIPEGNRIEKAAGITVRKTEYPGRSAVDRLVDARFFSFADREQERPRSVEGMYITEIEVGGAWHIAGFPGDSAVDRPYIGSLGPARPDNVFVDHRQPAQPSGGAALMACPLGSRDVASQHDCEEKERERSHCFNVFRVSRFQGRGRCPAWSQNRSDEAGRGIAMQIF